MVILIILATLFFSSIHSVLSIKQRMILHHHTLSLATFLQHVQLHAFWHNKNIYIEMIRTSDHTCFRVHNRLNLNDHKPLKMYCIPYSIRISKRFLYLNEWGFYGKHMTADPGSLILQNEEGTARIVISNRGRIRYCSDGTSLLGIPVC